MPRDSTITIVSLLPDLFGAYGDAGNSTILAKRLAWRGIPTITVTIESGDAVPESGDIYVIGGGEDALQIQAVRELDDSGSLHRAVERGAGLVGICGGMQILGRSFQTADGTTHTGLGLIDVESICPDGPRAVGEILVAPSPEWDLPLLSGFENHSGHTRLGTSARSLGKVQTGIGSGWGYEGAVDGHVLGTYMHGPILARNPALADMILGWAIDGPLEPLNDEVFEQLRRERIEAVGKREERPGRSWKNLIRRS